MAANDESDENPNRDGPICGACLGSSTEDASGTDLLATGWCGLPCGHEYHAACAIRWFREPNSRGGCPQCRDGQFALPVEIHLEHVSGRDALLHQLRGFLAGVVIVLLVFFGEPGMICK